MSKFLRWFIIVLLLPFFLFGCSKPTDTSRKIEVEFWTLQMAQFKDYFYEVIGNFESTHPDIVIKWIDVPFSEGEKKALNAVLSGSPPDIMNLNPEFSMVLAKHNALLNVKPLTDPIVLQNYLPPALEINSLNQENIFGIPWYITSSITLYNKSILNKASVNPQQIDNSYDTVSSMAEQLFKRSGSYAMMPDIARKGGLIYFLLKYNINILEPQADIHQATKILQQWVALYKKGYIPKETITEGHQEALNRYQAGTLAFLTIGPNFLKIIKENALEIYNRTDVMEQLKGTSPYVKFANMNLVIPKKAAHPQEALQFVLYLTNAENQLKLSHLVPVLPSHMGALRSGYFQKGQENTIEEKARILSARQLMHARESINLSRYHKEIIELTDNTVQKCFLENVSVHEELQKLHNRIQLLH